MANCPACGSYGWAYTWTTLGGRGSGTWVQDNALPSTVTSNNWEFFPGIYRNGINIAQGV